jgi:hypothetical protein
VTEKVKLYLASVALVFVGTVLWYSGDFYGRTAERQQCVWAR